MADEPSFEWDDAKDRADRLKHGVSFATAQAAFFDPHRVIAENLDHSGAEAQCFCLGKIADAVVTVRFIRIFGAGYWRKGKKIYEQQNR